MKRREGRGREMMMTLMRALSRWVCSGFGSGYASVIPGTFGTVAALLFWMMLHSWGGLEEVSMRVWLAVGTCFIGTLLVVLALEPQETQKDPQWIVIDEWAGLFITMVAIESVTWWSVIVAFGLFRFFDGLKWGPVALAERLPGGVGIMADDIVAGLESVIVLWLLYFVGLL
jgi:phosphatidylglycerophosphatase A